MFRTLCAFITQAIRDYFSLHYSIGENGALQVSVEKLLASREFRKQLSALKKLKIEENNKPLII
jgi:hypothetical protein